MSESRERYERWRRARDAFFRSVDLERGEAPAASVTTYAAALLAHNPDYWVAEDRARLAAELEAALYPVLPNEVPLIFGLSRVRLDTLSIHRKPGARWSNALRKYPGAPRSDVDLVEERRERRWMRERR
jgi:hypothetical protein